MSIEEMALKTYPVNEIGAEDCSLDLAKIPRRAYIEGAYAVLEEIEKIIAVGCDDTDFINLLRDKIGQLKKGE